MFTKHLDVNRTETSYYDGRIQILKNIKIKESSRKYRNAFLR